MTHSHRPKKFRNQKNFILVFSSVFIVTFGFLYYLGLVPGEIIDGTPKNTLIDDLKINILTGLDGSQNISNSQNTGVSDEPTFLEIPKVGVSIIVQNPDSTNVAVLDEYLTKGTVRYPGSGLIGNGNMLIFGHSSNWKVVKNQAYKSLNGIENLVPGDEIYIKGAGGTYVYEVTSERKTKAEDVFVDFSKKENMLTLSTCNTFGAKEERFVVEAKYIGKK